MAKILDGRVVQAAIEKKLAAASRRFALKPHLVIIQVGARPESNLYIERKKEFGQRIGVKVTHAQYPETVTEAELIAEITNFNNDPTARGIIVQIPLPSQLASARIVNAIKDSKDVDNLNGKDIFQSATARGVLALLNHYHITLTCREVVVVGRSALVGKPIALACLDVGATVTICHRETKNLSEITKRGDILIVAAGSRGLITAQHVKPNQIIVDVGINVAGRRKIVGDVVFEKVAPIVAAISPVPGGVGPLTIACLFENLFDAYCRQNKK